MPGSILILSPETFEADPRVALHFIAEALATIFDTVTFVALRPTIDVQDAGSDPSAIETQGRIRTLSLDPSPPTGVAGLIRRWRADPSATIGSTRCNAELDAIAREADVVLVQSGLAPSILPRLRRCAPGAEIVYFAATLPDGKRARKGVAALSRHAASVDRVIVTSRLMLGPLAAFGEKLVFMAPGIDPHALEPGPPIPPGGPTIAAVASSDFDAAAIHIAATSFPLAQFHLVGAPSGHRFPANVHAYATLRAPGVADVLRQAQIGIAALLGADQGAWLADSSEALALFGHLGIPAVCPHCAVDDRPLRIGYDPGRSASIRAAIHHALQAKRNGHRAPALSWQDTVERLFAPAAVRAERHSPQGECP